MKRAQQETDRAGRRWTSARRSLGVTLLVVEVALYIAIDLSNVADRQKPVVVGVMALLTIGGGILLGRGR